MEPPTKRKYEASFKLKVMIYCMKATTKLKSIGRNRTGIPTMMAYVICSKDFSKQTVMIVRSLMGFRYIHVAGLMFNIDNVDWK